MRPVPVVFLRLAFIPQLSGFRMLEHWIQKHGESMGEFLGSEDMASGGMVGS